MTNNNTPLQALHVPPPQLRLNYSTFVHGLAQCNIELNRKMLAELAVSEPFSFTCLMKEVQRIVNPTRSTLFKNTEDTQDSVSADHEEWPDTYQWAFNQLSPSDQEDALQYLHMQRRLSDLDRTEDLIPLEDMPEPGPHTQKYLEEEVVGKEMDPSIQNRLADVFGTAPKASKEFTNPLIPEEALNELREQKRNLKGLNWTDRFRTYEKESRKRHQKREEQLKNEKRE